MKIRSPRALLAALALAVASPMALAATCDVDNDGDVDRNDVNLVRAAIGTSVPAGDTRDANGDLVVTIADVRACVLRCTAAGCEIVTPPVNRPPVANDQAVSTAANTPLPIVLTGSDPDGQAITYSVLTSPAHGALSGSAPNLTYTPAAAYTGPDSFTFRVSDGALNSNVATVSITVPNRPPTAAAQSVTTSAGTPVAITLGGADPDGQAVSFSIVTGPANGSLSGVAPNLTYTPAAGFSGADSFVFRTSDGQLNSANATVSITVQPAAGGQGTLKLTLSQNVITGGSNLPFVTSLVDANGNPLPDVPVVNCTVANAGSVQGSAPVVVGSSVQTSATTRGSYQLSCTRPAPAQTANQTFVVIDTAGGAQQGLYGDFSLRLGNTAGLLDQIARALANGQAASVPALRTSLLAARANLVNMKRSTAFAPEGGFPPTAQQLLTRGVAAAPDDAAFNTLVINLIAKVEQARAFVNGLNPLALTDAQGAQLTALNTELEAMLTQLRSLNPGMVGVTQASSRLNLLMADVFPRYQVVLIDKIAQALQQNGFAAAPTTPQTFYAQSGPRQASPADFYAEVRPAFFGLVDLCLGSSIQGQLINLLYGDAFRQLENTMILLVANGLLNSFINNLSLDGIITGASLTFHVFNQQGSVIEGSVVNLLPARNDVILVGPDQVDAVRTLLENPPQLNDLESIYGFFENIKGAVASFNQSFQPPVEVFANACILGGGPGCNVASYPSGFTSVYTCSGFICLPSVVLVMVHNLDTGQWGFELFNFLGTR